jgi:hypothetical protein
MAEEGDRQSKSYLLSDLAQMANEMAPPAREWIISLLSDISNELFHPNSISEMFARYSSWDVGPLRTMCSGSFACDGLSEALASIKVDVSFCGGGADERDCFSDFLLPLDQIALRLFRAGEEGRSQSRFRKIS